MSAGLVIVTLTAATFIATGAALSYWLDSTTLRADLAAMTRQRDHYRTTLRDERAPLAEVHELHVRRSR